MKTKEIIDILTEAGYFVEEKIVNKNGINKTGIVMAHNEKDNVRPIFYLEDIKNCATAEDYAIELMKLFRNEDIEKSDIINKIKNFTFEDFLDNIYIAIQSSDIEDTSGVIIRPTQYEKINMYPYLLFDEASSCKITPELAESANISIDELFEVAKKNTFKKINIISLNDAIFDIFGIGRPINEDDEIYIITNDTGYKGAATILDTEYIKNFCKSKGWSNVAILPYSIHECIIIRYDEPDNLNRLKEIVYNIHKNEMLPEEVLCDEVFTLNIDDIG